MALRRKRNPIRTTGALVLTNPKKRRKARKSGGKRRTARRSHSTKRRRNTRRRTVRRTHNRRRNRSTGLVSGIPHRKYRRKAGKYNAWREKGGRFKHAKYRKAHNPRRRRNRRSRRNPLYLRNRRRNPLVLRNRRYRRNPLYLRNRRSSIRRRRNGVGGMLSKFGVVGQLIGSIFAFVPQALLGAVSIEPTMWIAKMLGPYVPQIPSSVFYAAAGLITALGVTLVSRFLPGSQSWAKGLAIAAASAGGGVAYYKWRSGQDTDTATEVGMLELRGFGSFADGFASATLPFGVQVG